MNCQICEKDIDMSNSTYRFYCLDIGSEYDFYTHPGCSIEGGKYAASLKNKPIDGEPILNRWEILDIR